MLDPQKHPFWKFSERILFLARRGTETIGRIAGVIDLNYNEFHDEKMGIWGFFECADDQEAATALMMAYTPPYYPGLVESCGFSKEKDLLAFLIDEYRLPEWMGRLAG
jgi:hypothetical protein